MFSMMPYYTSRTVKPHSERYISPFGEDFLRAFFSDGTTQSLTVDVEDQGDHYLLEADVPGVKRDNIHISVEDNVLTIAVEENEEKNEEDEKRNYVYHERRVRNVNRSFSLEGVDENHITAEYTDGVLRLNLPKLTQTPAESVRHIEIQ